MTLEPITGKVLRIFPQDTNTDEAILGKCAYDELDLTKLAVHTFESIDPDFYTDSKHAENPIIVTAGEGYGFSPIPKFMQELPGSGGLLTHLKAKEGYE